VHAQRATEIGAAWLLAAGAHSSPTPFGVLFSAFWCVVQRLLVCCSAPFGVLFSAFWCVVQRLLVRCFA